MNLECNRAHKLVFFVRNRESRMRIAADVRGGQPWLLKQVITLCFSCGASAAMCHEQQPRLAMGSAFCSTQHADVASVCASGVQQADVPSPKLKSVSS